MSWQFKKHQKEEENHQKAKWYTKNELHCSFIKLIIRFLAQPNGSETFYDIHKMHLIALTITKNMKTKK